MSRHWLWLRRKTKPLAVAAALAAVLVALLAAGCKSSAQPVDTGGKGAVANLVNTVFAPPAEGFKGGPRLYIKEELLDFGAVPLKTRVDATFHLQNIGDAPLKIDKAFARVVEGCCPPGLSLENATLQPGESLPVNMNFTMTEGMGGPHVFELVVQCNDALQPEHVVRLKADFGQ